MELKPYLQQLGKHGTKKLASMLNINWLSLYHIAAKRYNASPRLAMAIHRATQGVVDYRELYGEKAEEVWPKDMFIEVDAWKENDAKR